VLVGAVTGPELGAGRASRGNLEAARAQVVDLGALCGQLERELHSARAAEAAARHFLAACQAAERDVAGPGGEPPRRALAGAELRVALMRVGLRRTPQRAVHWRTWLGWLRDDGFDAAGRNPEGSFICQLMRSALVRRSGDDANGTYVLDVGLLREHRERLHRLRERMLTLAPPEQMSLFGDDRARRAELRTQIATAERVVREAWLALSPEPPVGWHAHVPPSRDPVAGTWLDGADDAKVTLAAAGGSST
jgi:hypothetical protein